MAILLVESLTHRFRQAAGRLSRGTLILFAVIALGAGLSAWSRLQIGALLRVDEGAVLTASVADLRGDCGTPSLYVLPVEAGHQSTYRILVDFLGGANRFPTIGGGATVPVLALPATRPPGVGLGRGLEDRCEAMTLRIEGAFASPSVDADFPGVGDVAGGGQGNTAMQAQGRGVLTLTYAKPASPDPRATLEAITLTGIADRWQHGSRRVAFTNTGQRDINVFVYEEDGYLFLNEQDSPVRPIGTRRSYVDVHLAAADDDADSTVVVYRRRPTADIELQHDLIGISTIFGIGISLLIEGALILVISLASAKPETRPLEGKETS